MRDCMIDSLCNCCGPQQAEPLYDAFLQRLPSYFWQTVILLVVMFFLFCWQWRITKKVLSWTVLVSLASLVFGFGVWVYTVGALQTCGTSVWDAVYTVPNAIISSLGMFVYQDDISELSNDILQDSFFMAMYSVAHFLAACITSFFLVRLVGMRLFYLIDLFRWSLCDSRKSLYVFWGINPQSVTLAESIYKEKPKESRIVFVNTVEQDNDNDREVSIRSLFDFIKVREEAHERICRIKADIVNCHVAIEGKAADNRDLCAFVAKDLRLTLLSWVMRHKAEIHLFFLSSDADKNINCMETLMTLPAPVGTEVNIYCHARRSAKTRWAEIKDICTYGKNPRIHIVDSSYLSVFCLKDNVAHHPVSFVKVDTQTATVTSEFRSMIIGFGETGEEAFKFLYEFGAFVDASGQKTPFHCTVIDEKASQLDGLFYVKAPAMKEQTDDAAGEQELRFMECAIDSRTYWEIVEKEVGSGLNYVVVAIADEELAINTAVNICTLATRWRDGSVPRLNVYVRSHGAEEYKRMDCIARELNGKLDGIRLEIFGNMEKIFHYDVIVGNKYVRQAQTYHCAYKCVSEGKEVTDSPEKAKSEWKNLLMVKGRLWNVEDVERKRDQNISNALHAATKIRLLEQSGHRIAEWKSAISKRRVNAYPGLEPEMERILINVAKCEHERWMAVSRLQGYTLATAEERDDGQTEHRARAKKHTDLVPWDELRAWSNKKDDTAVTQGYDCAVVDTSIQLYKEPEPENV